MVQGHKDAAATQFQYVVQLEPKDQLSARFAAALGAKPPELPKLPAQLAQAEGAGPAKPRDLAQIEGAASEPPRPEGEPPAGEQTQAPPPPAPPESLMGNWSAKPDDKTSIALTLNPDGTFAWTVSQNGTNQTLQGWAGYQDQVLTLAQEQGPPLVGKIAIDPAGKRFTFKPPGAPKAVAGLSFEKTATSAASSP
jgi:hypothetical protein